MIVYLLAVGYLLYLLYRHWDDKKHYWSRRRIAGPEAEIAFGNLRTLEDYSRPRSLVIRDWTKQYGKVYGFHEGYRKILVISDIDMMNELLVKKFDHFTARIPYPLNEGEDDEPKTHLVQATGAHWKKLRALASYAFTNKALRQIQNTVETSCLRMLEELQKREGVINMLDFYQELTLDIISKVALGQKDAKMRMQDAGSPSSGDFIDIFLDAEVDPAEIQSIGESKGARKLLFDEIVSLCIVMLLAGFETTANSLSYLTLFLANHPDVQERIYEEVEAVCPGDTIAYEDLAELKYTEAAIKESLRHYPLASFVVNRECTRATSIGGIHLEVGDKILTDTLSMHMDKEIWGEDAEEFRPERWLEEPTCPRVAFQSFGEGPRMCMGMRLAYMEEKTAITHMLKNFRIRKSHNTNPIKLVGNLTVAPERLNVILERRD